jgi:hypothetical protein
LKDNLIIPYHYIIVALRARLHMQYVFLARVTVIFLNKTKTEVQYFIYSKVVDMCEMFSFFLGNITLMLE